MPWYAEPLLPPDVERAINVLGANAARVAVLWYIGEHPHSTVREIADGTELALGTVKNHVAALVALGALEADPAPTVPYALRRGMRTRYIVQQQQLADQYRKLGRLLGLQS